MSESKEIELKLELSPEGVGELLALPLLATPSSGAAEQVSTYFDTPEGHVRKAGFSVRVRRKGPAYLQTVKEVSGEAGGFSARGEWERRIAGPELDFEALRETPVGRILARKKVRNALAVASETRVERTTWMVKRDGSTIEVILDRGEVRTGEFREPVCEIELELKRGSRKALFDVAREIGLAVPLRMGVLSKSERGVALSKRPRRIHKAEPIAIEPSATIADAFAAIVQSCLRHFRRNEALAVSEKDAEAVHQLRVATRRLRSAFTLFKPVLAGPEYEMLRAELRRLSQDIGEARDLDVILAELRRSGGARRVAGGELPRLKRERAAAYDRLLARLRSDTLPRLFIDLVAWVEAGSWRERSQAQRSIEAFAEERLGRLWRRMRKHGKDVAALAPEERHKLRIQGKKLRYASEFFAGLSLGGDRKRWKIFVGTLEHLQDSLGQLNDIETLRAMSPDATVEADTARLLSEAQDSLDTLRKSGPYWR